MTAPTPSTPPVPLKACPFCGNPRPEAVGSPDGDYVECGSCLATMPPHDAEVPNEIARWNTRFGTDPDAAGVREACAKVADKRAARWALAACNGDSWQRGAATGAQIIAADIRGLTTPAAPRASDAGEGEREPLSRQLAYAFCGKLKQSQKADVSERLGIQIDYSLPALERDKRFLRAVVDADAVGILCAAVASFLPDEFATPRANPTAADDEKERLVELIRTEAFWHGAPTNDGPARKIADRFFATSPRAGELREALGHDPLGFIEEARAHAADMPAVIQRDYLYAALGKIETVLTALRPDNAPRSGVGEGSRG